MKTKPQNNDLGGLTLTPLLFLSLFVFEGFLFSFWIRSVKVFKIGGYYEKYAIFQYFLGPFSLEITGTCGRDLILSRVVGWFLLMLFFINCILLLKIKKTYTSIFALVLFLIYTIWNIYPYINLIDLFWKN